MMFSIWLRNRFQSLKHRCRTFMNRYAKRKELTLHIPNATRQARLKAGARDERALEAVACTRLFGLDILLSPTTGSPEPATDRLGAPSTRPQSR
jgi:hypothetical protein